MVHEITELDETSPAWCRRLIDELSAADGRAAALARTLTQQQLNWKPNPGAWSIGQCLEHLSVTTDVYLPAIASVVVGAPSDQVPEITPGWFGRWFIRNYIEASPATKRAKAPKKIAPLKQDVEAVVLERFLRGNAEIRALVHRARNHDVNRIRFKNPLVPLVRFTVGTGFEILAKHQVRHLLQAERVRAQPTFPSPRP